MKIFVNGLQRSGTNYLHQLLELNTDYEILDINGVYWKHDIFNKPRHSHIDTKTIFTVIKNPYTWVESICFRNPVDIKGSFTEYTLHDDVDYLGPYKINLVNLVKLYKKFYESWLEFGTHLIKYEDTIRPNILKKTLLSNKIKIKEIKNIKIPEFVKYSDDFDKNRIKSYIDYKTFYLTKDNIEIINDILGDDFFKKINYSVK